MVVQNELDKLHIKYENVKMGKVSLLRELLHSDRIRLEAVLVPMGFELLDNKKNRLTEQIKSLIMELVQNKNGELKKNLSDYLISHIHHDYHYLSNLFSEVEGITIEKFFIFQKVEKAKELLVYNELSLNEIAYLLNYSSTAHLSNQFKKVTGLTPSVFKNIGVEKSSFK
jgi:AraC-like DNA-binding protein